MGNETAPEGIKRHLKGAAAYLPVCLFTLTALAALAYDVKAGMVYTLTIAVIKIAGE